KEEVDLVILLSHFGLPQDIKLAGEVDGIDVLLSGHTHNALKKALIVNDTIIIQSGCHGTYIGQLNVEVEKGKISSYDYQLIEVSSQIKADPSIGQHVEALFNPYQSKLS